MISFSFIDFLILIFGYVIINWMTPQEYKEEIGALVLYFFQTVWTIAWIVIFVIIGFHLHLSITL